MALGIHKPGQGYWVRVLTAVGAGALVLATAAWAWGQAVNIQLPARAYDFEVASVPSDWTTGSALTLVSIDPLSGEETPVGNGVIEAVSGTGLVTVGSIDLLDGGVVADSEALSSGVDSSVRIEGTFDIPIISPLYVQGGVVAVILLLGMLLVFVLVGSKKGSVEFLIATDGEMRKVNWSSRREVIGSTWVVIVAAFLISAVLFVIDQVFAGFFRFIDVLN